MEHARAGAVCVVAAALAAGCAAPTASVVHELPAAVPAGDVAAIVPGRFEVAAGDAWMAEFLAAEVNRRAAAARGDAPPAEPAVTMGGTVTAEVTDRRGRRPARRMDPAAGRLVDVQVPFLVRTAKVRVVFALAPADGAAPVKLETAESYTSAEDPRVRGPAGLERGDDPSRVPPAETILRELLVQCVDEAWGMIAPVRMPVTLQFRRADGEAAEAGLEAVERKDFAAAVEHFRAAVQERPDSAALRFNLAAALEGQGQFAAAARHYQAAADAAGDAGDPEARRAAQRTTRLAELAAE